MAIDRQLRTVRDAVIPKQHHDHINRLLTSGEFRRATNVARSWIITAVDTKKISPAQAAIYCRMLN